MGTIQVLQFGLIALGLIGSLYAVYRIARSNYTKGKAWAVRGADGGVHGHECGLVLAADGNADVIGCLLTRLGLSQTGAAL